MPLLARPSTDAPEPRAASGPFDARNITRPAPVLLTYYVITAALTVVGFPFVIVPLLFRYHTLRYRFDDDGISMSWGVIFHREVQLTYRRIQDIHVTRNLLQRWMGLANVAIQTASGNAGAEMTIEGVLEADELRDYLYQQMRGVRGEREHAAPVPPSSVDPASVDPTSTAQTTTTPVDPQDEALELLRQIRDELRALAATRPVFPP